MISNSLQYASDALDQFLKNRFGLDESKVVLNNLIDSDGTVPQLNENKVVISLINIEKETAKPFYTRNRQTAAGSYTDMNPAERYNLDLLISANFDEYSETLKYLDAVIGFFQSRPCIDASVLSTIPAGVNKLEFEIEKITYHQMQSLWTAMGAKYQPSVIYKMRLVTVQANETEGFSPAVLNTSTLITS